MTLYRVVFDTNVLLSAFVFGGNPQKLFESARSGSLQLIISSSILFEFATILKTKFSWDDAYITDAVRTVGYCSELVKPITSINVLSDDQDNRILECAIEGKADFIASGDRHLVDLKAHENIEIVKPKDLLIILGEEPI